MGDVYSGRLVRFVGFGDLDGDLTIFGLVGSIKDISNFGEVDADDGGDDSFDFVFSNCDFLDTRSDAEEVGDLEVALDMDGNRNLGAFDLALVRVGVTKGIDLVDDGDIDFCRSESLILNKSPFAGFFRFLSSPPSSCGMVCELTAEEFLVTLFLVRLETDTSPSTTSFGSED